MGKIISAQGMSLAEMTTSKAKMALLLEKSEMLEAALKQEIAKRMQFRSFLAFAIRKLGSLEIRKADLLENIRYDVSIATGKDADGGLVLTLTAVEENLAGEPAVEGESGVSSGSEESSKA